MKLSEKMAASVKTLVILATLVLYTKSQEHFLAEEFLVTYEIEYPEGDCNTAKRFPPSAVKLSVPRGSSALYVMEKAASENHTYRFTATYFGWKLGYYVDSINGVQKTKDFACSWYLYVLPQKGLRPRKVLAGVSNYLVPNNKTKIILRYEGQQKSDEREHQQCEDTQAPLTFGVKYSILYPDSNCPRSDDDTDETPTEDFITVPRGSSTLDLMKQVKDDYSNTSKFTMTYYENYEGKSIAYFVDAFGNTRETTFCFWAFLYEPPEEYAYIVKFGLSNFVIPEHGGRVILRFQSTSYSGILEPAKCSETKTDVSNKEQDVSDQEQDGSDQERDDSDQETSEKEEL